MCASCVRSSLAFAHLEVHVSATCLLFSVFYCVCLDTCVGLPQVKWDSGLPFDIPAYEIYILHLSISTAYSSHMSDSNLIFTVLNLL